MCENVRNENPRSRGELPPHRLLARKTTDVPNIGQLLLMLAVYRS